MSPAARPDPRPVDGRRRVARPRAVAGATLAALGVLLLSPAQAFADGPGYGGDADRLSVTWSEGGAPRAAGERLSSSAGSSALVVTGLGFRSRSPVEVQVGDAGTTGGRSDEVGELQVSLAVGSGDEAATGTSVFAVGRAPSGTTRTLVGSVPPPPGGFGPVDAVPVAAAVLLGLVVVGRLARAVLRVPGTGQTGSKR